MPTPLRHTRYRVATARLAVVTAGMIGVGCFAVAPTAVAETPSRTTESTDASESGSARAELAALLVRIVSDVARDDTTQDLLGSVGDATTCLLSRTVGAGQSSASTSLVVTACAAPLAAIDPAVGVRLASAAELDRILPLLARARSTETAPEVEETRPQRDTSRQQQSGRTARYPMPATGTVTSPFGDGRNHQGIDIAAQMNSPIRAVADGTVIDAGPAQGFGLWVRIRHNDGTVTTYGHNNTNTVTVGQRVSAGQQIATIGSRGDSSGPHVHFEVDSPAGTKLDPQAWLSQRRSTGGA